MYSLGLLAKDRVVALSDVPQSSIGAPTPTVLANEHKLSVIFYLEDFSEKWDGKSVRVIGTSPQGEPWAIIRFRRVSAHYFGVPNDEAFAGHPLAKRGFSPYGAFEVKDSSWRKLLKERNQVHRQHSDKMFDDVRHFALTFHDSIFECLARDYEVQQGRGHIQDVVDEELQRIRKGQHE